MLKAFETLTQNRPTISSGEKMLFRTKQKSHERTMRELERKLQIAEMKRNERKLKYKIIKTYLPFRIMLKFNKLIVISSIAVIIAYTIAAIFVQLYTHMELSPTLTTCVYTFFGTELLSLAGIKIYDTKYSQVYSDIGMSNDYMNEDPEAVG